MLSNIISSKWKYPVGFLLSCGVFMPAVAQPAKPVEIVQTRGLDQSVAYPSLTKYGPWDDRNYMLTKADISVLAPNESDLHPQIPAFFRVELRKEWPHLQRKGPAQYPRAARQLFEIRYGGLMQNGKIEDDRRLLAESRVPVPVNSEVQLNTLLGANEVTVEINPSNPGQAIAGSNNAGGQEMYYSTDGGVSWTIQGVLPNTCCDPTVDWSSDGSVAYAAALSGTIGVSAWRSFDGGQTWVDRVDLTSSGSDKEFIHVDQSAASPHTDNVYLTYHDGNVMQFARSTDMGSTYGIQSFTSAPSGIGSDITTDAAGNIYYFYAATNSQQIVLLKSTDGGLSFATPQAVANTNGAFDFPIPSIESRRAWIYAATDADLSQGPYSGSVYVSWTDTVGAETNDPALNHTRVQVAYSRDGGATWSLSTPHPTSDMLTVDRWNQWLAVDENGTVHVVFYDTRNSVGRTGVDLYYTFSIDGGVTWNDLERISTSTSSNLTDGQEFGDYNGISVVGPRIIPAWTDNRDGPPNAKDVFAADVVNVTATPGFLLNGGPLDQDVCAPGNLADIDVSVQSVQGFSDPVTLSYSGLPAGSVAGFTVNPVPTGGSSTAQVAIGTVPSANYSFDIVGAATGIGSKSLTVNVAAYDSAPGVATLLAPADTEVLSGTSTQLSWSAAVGAASYVVELDDDPTFASIDFSTTTQSTSLNLDIALSTGTTYYWRIRAVNPCNAAADSAIFSFTTGQAYCRSGYGPLPDPGSASDQISVATAGLLSDIDVSLQVTHTWVGDLTFTLVHVDTGTSVTFIDRPGVPASTFGCGSDNIDAILDDEAASSVEVECAVGTAVAGTFIPNNSLSAFDGEDFAGTWRLDVSDSAGSDFGTLDEWCILPTIDSAPDTDGDGVPDALDNCIEVANPSQCDGDGDDFGNHCDGDFNGDQIVNGLDIGAFKAGFGTDDPTTDLNCDGITNGLDIGPLRVMFGSPPGPSALVP